MRYIPFLGVTIGQVISKILLTLFLANFLNACNYLTSREVERAVNKPTVQKNLQFEKLSEEEESTQLNFKYIYTRIIEPKCSICHDSSNKLQLESYDDVSSNISRIQSAVFVKKSMPKIAKLTAAEEKLLWHWLQLKAPYYSKNAPEDLPKLVPTFDSIYDRIFVSRCIICHNPDGPAKKMPLDKKTLLDSRYGIVVPGNPDESSLIQDIEHTREEVDMFMPPPSKGFKKLSVEEISAIRTWITNGAKD